jgi:hypothetical protein
VGVPAEQRLVVGLVAKVCPFALPQAPFTTVDVFTVALQLDGLPPLIPLQFHVQFEPLCVTGEAVPTEQRLVVGAIGYD